MGDLAIYCNVGDFSFSLSPTFTTPVQNPLRLTQGLDILVDLYFVQPTGNPAAPWTYLDPVAYVAPQIGIAQTNLSLPPYLAKATTFTYFSGEMPYLEFLLNLSTDDITAALGSSPALKAVFEVDWQNGSRQLIIQCGCIIARSVLISAGSVPTPTGNYYTQAQTNLGFLKNMIGRVTELSSGAGTLSGLATIAGATTINTAVLFTVSGVSTGYYLDAGTDATTFGVQRPDDFDAATNAVVWRQFL